METSLVIVLHLQFKPYCIDHSLHVYMAFLCIPDTGSILDTCHNYIHLPISDIPSLLVGRLNVVVFIPSPPRLRE